MTPGSTAADLRATIRNILVMVDLSAATEAILAYAAAWAGQLDAAVHVAHFLRPLSYTLAGDAYGELLEKLQEEAVKELQAIAESPVLRAVRHQTHLDPGEVLDGLPGLISSNRIDLVMVGSAARTGLAKVVLGSTAETVFRSLGIPVLILGPGTARERPWGRPQRILLATDFGPAAARSCAYALDLARVWQAKVEVLHVLAERDGGGHEGAMARLQALSAGAKGGATLHIAEGKPAEAIVATARNLSCDLIVLGVRRAPRFPVYTGWATAYQVLATADCPVLTVREPGE